LATENSELSVSLKEAGAMCDQSQAIEEELKKKLAESDSGTDARIATLEAQLKTQHEDNEKALEELRRAIAAEALLKVALETENSDLKVSLKDAGAMMDTTNT
jgi:hypothetical protein